MFGYIRFLGFMVDSYHIGERKLLLFFKKDL